MHSDLPHRPRRSVLYVPASNEKALAKAASLDCDAVILDLEDAVGPDEKQAARGRLKGWFAARPAQGPETVVRINALAGEWGRDDLAAARACRPDAILLPKVDTPRDISDVGEMLDEDDTDLRIWAMIETPRAMLNLGAIAELGRDRAARLACLVAGTNDLASETGIAATNDRRFLAPHLAQMVMAARAGGLDVLDGPFNDFGNATVFEDQCRQAAQMGFDGKTLIHPAQIATANTVFAPSAEALAEARAIADAFALPGNAGKGVISMNGRMVERLHLMQAGRLLAKAEDQGAPGMRLYRFLSGPDDSTFCHKVTAALNRGWQLHGSPTYAFDAEAKAMRCGQAVVKDVEGAEYDASMKLGEY